MSGEKDVNLPSSEEPPTKAQRKQCYDARDKHWNCLDSNEEEEERCKETRKIYEKFCSQKWVIHFDQKYRFEKFKQRNEAQEKAQRDSFIQK